MKLSIKVVLQTSVLILFAVCAIGAQFAAAAEVRIGIFDMQKAMNESQKGQKAKTALSSKAESYDKKLKSREDQIKKMREDYEKQLPVLSADARMSKEKDLRNVMRTYEDEAKDAQNQMQRAEMELLQPIVTGIVKVAVDYSKANGFTLVLDAQKAGVVFATEGIDITDEVIKRFDAAK